MILPTTLDDLQLWITDAYNCAQLFTAIAGLLAILLPIARSFAIYHRITDGLAGVSELLCHKVSWLLTSSPSTSLDGVAQVCLKRSDPSAQWVSGLVNTGNTCFLNSVIAALSSLPRLHTYLHDQQDNQGPVTGSLLKTIRQLSKPLYSRTAFRPRDMVASLSKRVIINREQQDAQELFQLIVGALDAEASDRNAAMLGGLKFLTQSQTQFMRTSTTPFTGLLASRLSCMQCGYTEAVRHFSFNNIQLVVPRAYTTTLDACLRQFTSIEYLQDATCRKCALIHTLRTVKKKKKKLEIEARLKGNRIEEELEGIQRAASSLSTKQVMFAKPPKILCLHLSRSAFHASGAVYKNTCQILFPEYLDLAPYTTTGILSTQPNAPISTPQQDIAVPRYRLMSTIEHFGSHSYGHFVAFKRRIVTEQCMCTDCCDDKQGHESWEALDEWYRISDSKVDLCSFDVVQQSNPYMMLYELMDEGEESRAEQEEEEKAKEDVDDLMMAHSTDSSTPSGLAYTYCASAGAEEALRIANALLMDDHHRNAARWSDGTIPLISIP
ncbi:hypothetical protein BJV82DRAFT_600766 [Fennellomyces sp. T-0311]|nr:hypothetical protein BJV82DRAFT_600766 [Fennellomyces sp. T-0311]